MRRTALGGASSVLHSDPRENVMAPLRKHAEEMRDMYGAEIQAARDAGDEPSPLQLESWERYDAAARSEDPAALLGPVQPART
jgi:hypothetical protein